MSFLAKRVSGIVPAPQFYIFHAPPGVGKTTFASQFANPLFVDLENGTKQLDVQRLTGDEIKTFEDILTLVDELITTTTDYKTFVVDSATALEALIHKHVCGTQFKSIEDVGGGFGKGYQAAKEDLSKLLEKLKVLAKKMDVIIIAHSLVKTFTDPITNASYDRYVLQMNQKCADLLLSAADNVFFIKYEIDVLEANGKKSHMKSTGERILCTEWRASFDAKNRLNLPAELPLDYKSFKDAVEKYKPKSCAELKEDIRQLSQKLDAKTLTLVSEKVKEAGNNQLELQRIKSKLLKVAA